MYKIIQGNLELKEKLKYPLNGHTDLNEIINIDEKSSGTKGNSIELGTKGNSIG